MSERVVVIYVSRDFRDKIKAKKHELTYEKFLDNLLKNTEGFNPQVNNRKIQSRKRKEVSS